MKTVFLLLAFVLSAGVCSFILPRIILISFKKRLFDNIDERKVHSGIVPRLGGVAFTPSIVMAMGMLLGLYILQPEAPRVTTLSASQISLGLCALMLIYLEGISDDLVGMGYKAKFGCQVLCALMMAGSGFWLNDLHGFLGIHALRWYVGMPLSALLIVFIINAINLIDGIDGLASGLSMVSAFFLGCLLFKDGDMFSAAMAFALLGTLVPFFIYNVFGKADKERKIFMGDCGSQTIGLMLGVLAIRFSMREPSGSALALGSPAIAFSTIMVPCLDVLRVMLGRIRKKKSPFQPDTTHIHHKFLKLGMSHRTAMICIIMLDVFFVLLNLGLVGTFDINLIIFIDIVIWCVMQIWLSRLIVHRKRISERLGEDGRTAEPNKNERI